MPAVKNLTQQDIEQLVNHDGLLCKPPWRNKFEQRQYYARHINRMLWRYFSQEDWNNVAELIDEIKIKPKLKKATRFLVSRHT